MARWFVPWWSQYRKKKDAVQQDIILLGTETNTEILTDDDNESAIIVS